MGLIFIVVASDEGLVMAEVGSTPSDDFYPYSVNMVDASQQLSDSSNLGDPVCSAIVLPHGRIIILNKVSIAGQEIYMSVLCSKVPSGMQALLKRIEGTVSNSLAIETAGQETNGE